MTLPPPSHAARHGQAYRYKKAGVMPLDLVPRRGFKRDYSMRRMMLAPDCA
jgi:hypothetical protein